jgi:hypothetical protein
MSDTINKGCKITKSAFGNRVLRATAQVFNLTRLMPCRYWLTFCQHKPDLYCFPPNLIFMYECDGSEGECLSTLTKGQFVSLSPAERQCDNALSLSCQIC